MQNKSPAPNARFGATAAVISLKVPCEHERKQPAECIVETAAVSSYSHVVCNVPESVVESMVLKKSANESVVKRKVKNL